MPEFGAIPIEEISEFFATEFDRTLHDEKPKILKPKKQTRSPNPVENTANTFSITKFGAVADGETDTSGAFAKAWKQACASNGGTLHVPPGNFFLTGAVFKGPCVGKTNFKVEGKIVASSSPLKEQESWIEFSEVKGLTILGGGTFDGNGKQAWSTKSKGCSFSNKCKLPYSLSFGKVSGAYITGITSLDSKMFHIAIQQSQNIVIDNIKIVAPGDSPNTDGIHIGKSKDISVINSKISTGDDCIGILDGNTGINIDSIQCGPGHGISIGSLGKYKDEKDVSGVTVSNSVFTNTDNGLRIKTWAPSTVQSKVSNIEYSNITFNNVQNPIVIDQHYCPHGSCKKRGESGIQIQHVKFESIRGTSATRVGVILDCSKAAPCQDIEFADINVVEKGTRQPVKAVCSNANVESVGPNRVDNIAVCRGSVKRKQLNLLWV